MLDIGMNCDCNLVVLQTSTGEPHHTQHGCVSYQDTNANHIVSVDDDDCLSNEMQA